MSEPLPAVALGDGPERAVLLHGFGGSARAWAKVQDRLGDLSSLAFDLPGHGAALDRTDLSTVDARDAVLAEIERLGITRAHLVGHSRGGAVACLVAAKGPEAVASLTLLAPGGFGEEIAADALAEFAAARTEAELRSAMNALYAPARPSRAMVEYEVRTRENPGAEKALRTIHAGMAPDGRQGTLRLDAFKTVPYPVTVIWGDADAVLPVAQANAIPSADVRILPGIGHMLPVEVPQTIADAVAARFRHNREPATTGGTGRTP